MENMTLFGDVSPRRCAAFAAVAVCLFTPAAHAANITLQTVVAFPNNVFTQLLGINNSEVIAGYMGVGQTPMTLGSAPNKGLVFTPPNYNAQGSQLNENFPGSSQTQVVAINNVASTAPGAFETGGFWVDNNTNIGGTFVNHGFLVDQNGGFHTVDQNPGTDVVDQILGLNNNGEAAGYSQDTAGVQHPYTVTSNGMGGYNFTPINPPGSTTGQATTVDNAGEVGGFFTDGLGVTHGFLDNAGNFTTFDAPGATFTQILGLNNLGDFVGDYTDAGGNTHGFVDIGGNFVSIDGFNGTTSTVINGINDNGYLVGFYMDPTQNGNTIGLVGTFAPEPGSMLLGGLGLGLLALKLKAKRRIA